MLFNLNVDLVHPDANHGIKAWYILHPNIHVMKSVINDWNLDEKSLSTCQYL